MEAKMDVPLIIKAPITHLVLDNTQRATFALCPRKFYWHHQRGLISKFGSTALRYGSTWHGTLEGYYKTIKEKGWAAKDEAVRNGALRGKQVWERESKDQIYIDDYRSYENCMEAFLQYLVFFQMDQSLVEIIDTEKLFEQELYIEEQDEWYQNYDYSFLPPIIFTGKIDRTISLSGMHWTLDEKSTGQAMDVQVQRMNRLAQLIGYSWAGRRVYPDHEIAGSLVCIHRIYSGKLKDGGYGKLSIDFRRVPQIYSAGDYVQWKHSFYHVAAGIYGCLEREEWPMNHDACYQYGNCTYTRLCDQNKIDLTEVNTDGFTFKPWDVRNEAGAE
jgi:hypothetical protein